MSSLQTAIQLAHKLHLGQVDKAGKPYIEHCLRVMNSLDTELEKIVGVLHDTLEDSEITYEELEIFFGEEVARLVNILTKRPGEDYFDYLDRIIEDQTAIRVKLADLEDNLDRSRINNPSSKDKLRWVKYELAKEILNEYRK